MRKKINGKESPERISADEAQRALEKDRDDRLKKANAEIAKVCEVYGVAIVPVPQITPDGRIGAVVQLQATTN